MSALASEASGSLCRGRRPRAMSDSECVALSLKGDSATEGAQGGGTVLPPASGLGPCRLGSRGALVVARPGAYANNNCSDATFSTGIRPRNASGAYKDSRC